MQRRSENSAILLMYAVALLASLVSVTGCAFIHKPWPGKPYDLVKGYQFTNPLGPLKEQSPILNETIDLQALAKLECKEAQLNPDQTRRLLKAAFGKRFEGMPAPCYFPHHIFVFYSDKKPVGAIEMCFMCAGKRCWPDQPKGSKTNYPQLEKLAKKLGIGTEAPKGEKVMLPEDPFAPRTLKP